MYLHSGKWLSKQGTAFTTPTGYVDVNSKWKEIIDCSYTLLHMFHRHKLDGQTALWLSSLDPPTSVPSMEESLDNVLYKIFSAENKLRAIVPDIIKRNLIPEFTNLPKDALEWLRKEKYAQ
mmetsp:Transcript_17143/g.21118  ORF Transcript_17143/g.21118 Transcript_17143/m.21118 type:complete len:121 (-) Transcript_17143:787-1149(-)